MLLSVIRSQIHSDLNNRCRAECDRINRLHCGNVWIARPHIAVLIHSGSPRHAPRRAMPDNSHSPDRLHSPAPYSRHQFVVVLSVPVQHWLAAAPHFLLLSESSAAPLQRACSIPPKSSVLTPATRRTKLPSHRQIPALRRSPVFVASPRGEPLQAHCPPCLPRAHRWPPYKKTRRVFFEESFRALFSVIHAALRARNAASGGDEMLRLRTYDKLQNFVREGQVKKTGKKYKGVTNALLLLSERLKELRKNGPSFCPRNSHPVRQIPC